MIQRSWFIPDATEAESAIWRMLTRRESGPRCFARWNRGAYGEGIKVTVVKPPQAGAANEAVIKLIAAVLQLPIANVQILRGHTNPRKQALILGLTAQQIEQRLLS